jgi:hypothetical protein
MGNNGYIRGIIDDRLIFKKNEEIIISEISSNNLMEFKYKHNYDTIENISYSYENNKLVGITTDFDTIIWDMLTGKCIHHISDDFHKNNRYPHRYFIENGMLIMSDNIHSKFLKNYSSKIIIRYHDENKIEDDKSNNKFNINHITYNKNYEYIDVNFHLHRQYILFPSLEEIAAMTTVIDYYLKKYISDIRISAIIAKYI